MLRGLSELREVTFIKPQVSLHYALLTHYCFRRYVSQEDDTNTAVLTKKSGILGWYKIAFLNTFNQRVTDNLTFL